MSVNLNTNSSNSFLETPTIENLQRENEGLKHTIEELQAQLNRCQKVFDESSPTNERKNSNKRLKGPTNSNNNNEINNNNNNNNHSEKKVLDLLPFETELPHEYSIVVPVEKDRSVIYKVPLICLGILSPQYHSESSFKEIEERTISLGQPPYGEKEFYNESAVTHFIRNLVQTHHQRRVNLIKNSAGESLSMDEAIQNLTLAEKYQIEELIDEYSTMIKDKIAKNREYLFIYLDYAANQYIFEEIWYSAVKEIPNLCIDDLSALYKSFCTFLEQFEDSFALELKTLGKQNSKKLEAVLAKKLKILKSIFNKLCSQFFDSNFETIDSRIAKWFLILNLPYLKDIVGYTTKTSMDKKWGNLNSVKPKEKIFIHILRDLYHEKLDETLLNKLEKITKFSFSRLENHSLLLFKGYIHAQRKDFRVAIKNLKEAIQHYALNPASLTYLAHLYTLTSQYKKALKLFGQALDVDPTYFLARNRKCVLLCQMGDFDKAIKELTFIRNTLVFLPNDDEVNLTVKQQMTYDEIYSALRDDIKLECPVGQDFSPASKNNYCPSENVKYLLYCQFINYYLQMKNWGEVIKLFNEFHNTKYLFPKYRNQEILYSPIESSEIYRIEMENHIGDYKNQSEFNTKIKYYQRELQRDLSEILSEIYIYLHFEKKSFTEAIEVLKESEKKDELDLNKTDYNFSLAKLTFKKFNVKHHECRQKIRLIYTLYCQVQLDEWIQAKETLNKLLQLKIKFDHFDLLITQKDKEKTLSILKNIIDQFAEHLQTIRKSNFFQFSFIHPLDSINV